MGMLSRVSECIGGEGRFLIVPVFCGWTYNRGFMAITDKTMSPVLAIKLAVGICVATSLNRYCIGKSPH